MKNVTLPSILIKLFSMSQKAVFGTFYHEHDLVHCKSNLETSHYALDRIFLVTSEGIFRK